MKPGINRGSKNFKAKLTENDVIEIRRSKQSQMELAEKYKVSQSTIANILLGRTWAWLPQPKDKQP